MTAAIGGPPGHRPLIHGSSNVHGFAILRQTGENWIADNAMRLSAALSLYTILSLAPLLVITFKIVTVIWHGQDVARQQIMRQMTQLMGSQAADAIKPMLDSTHRHGNGHLATILSTLVLIFSATGVFAELQDSMNTIWQVKPAPHQGFYAFIRNRLLSLGMVFGIAFLLLVSMFLTAVLSSFANWFLAKAGWVLIAVDVVVSSMPATGETA